jgi:hypothetical protein
MTMPYGKEEAPKFGFDVTKANKIFDLLLQEGQIKLSQYHTIPSADELKKIRYCKWNNATSHSTNDCKIFCQQIQAAIKQGRLKFEIPKKPSKPMKIDQHPFPTNVVEVNGKAKVLTSQSAKASGAVDLEVQISAEEVKGKCSIEEAECSKGTRHRLGGKVTVKDRMRVSVHDRLEERASNRVPDEVPLCREPKRRQAPEHNGVRNPWWCPDRLTKSQKRRVQHLRPRRRKTHSREKES